MSQKLNHLKRYSYQILSQNDTHQWPLGLCCDETAIFFFFFATFTKEMVFFFPFHFATVKFYRRETYAETKISI